MAFVLTDQNSIASQFISELRDEHIQKDRLRFCANMERLGSIMAYEISKKLEFEISAIKTPLDRAEGQVIGRQPVLLTILRAGIPYLNGFQHFFDRADCGFIGAGRKEDGDLLKINLDYLAAPSLQGRDVILIDPMLASGSSIIAVWNAIRGKGTPRHLFIACVVAAPEGLKNIKENLATPHSIWCVAVDKKLNKELFIVPGLGDAGDLSFGEKL